MHLNQMLLARQSMPVPEHDQDLRAADPAEAYRRSPWRSGELKVCHFDRHAHRLDISRFGHSLGIVRPECFTSSPAYAFECPLTLRRPPRRLVIKDGHCSDESSDQPQIRRLPQPRSRRGSHNEPSALAYVQVTAMVGRPGLEPGTRGLRAANSELRIPC